MVILEDSLEIKTSKMSIIMEVDVVALEAGGDREDVGKCKEAMMQVALLTTITMEN